MKKFLVSFPALLCTVVSVALCCCFTAFAEPCLPVGLSTGQQAMYAVYIAVIVVALIAIILMIVLKRREKK